MGSALRGGKKNYSVDAVKDFVQVKEVCSGSSSSWCSARFEPLETVNGHTKSAALKFRVGGSGRQAAVVLRDTTGDGRYDVVEQAEDLRMNGTGSPNSERLLLPNMAMDMNGDGTADIMMMDTIGDGRYNKVLHKDRAALSFIASMASEEPASPMSPMSPSSTSRSFSATFSSPRLRRAADTAEDADAQPLAPGWEQIWSQSQNCYYYCHRATRRVTWDRTEAIPCIPAVEEATDVRPLAPGWATARSKSRNNTTYYRHAVSGRKTWHASEARLGYPEYWSHSFDTDHFVDLVPGSSTFRAAQMLLSSTFMSIRTRDRKTRLPAALEAIKVWRVENSAVWGRYVTYRAQLQKKAEAEVSMPAYQPPAKTTELLPSELRRSLGMNINEVYLFHGTSPSGAAGITHSGFDLAKSSGTACYGRGVYLSECSSKSDEYCEVDEDGPHRGHCAMFLCRVALGRVLAWPHAEFSEELKAEWSSGCYDSILGDRQKLRGTYREFVLPPEAQDGAYPEYLVIYKRVYDD